MKPYAPSKKQIAAAKKLKIDVSGMTGGQVGSSIRSFFIKPKTFPQIDNTPNVSNNFKFKDPEVQAAYERFQNSDRTEDEDEFNRIRDEKRNSGQED